MTGEITLRGRVLPIGGLKEKIYAAIRAGIKTVIIPEDNKREIVEFDKDIIKAIKKANAAHFSRFLNSIR